MTSHWHHFDVMCPLGFLINRCQTITFLILKSDITENSRIELRGIVLPVPSNQISYIYHYFTLQLCTFVTFPVSHRNWWKMWVDYWEGGWQRVCWPPTPPPSQIIGGGGLGLHLRQCLWMATSASFQQWPLLRPHHWGMLATTWLACHVASPLLHRVEFFIVRVEQEYKLDFFMPPP